MSSATDATQDDSGNDGSSTDDRPESQKVDFNGVIDTDVLDPFIRHAKALYDEYTVVINRYGWHIRVVESSNVTQMDARIHCDDFEQYDSVRGGLIGVSHESLKEMVEFIEATDGDAHMSIEDGVLTLSDGDRLFTDTELINPDSVRKRPERYDMEVQSSVTVGRESNDMWDLTKFVRSNSGYTTVNMEVNRDRLQLNVTDSNDTVEDSIDVYGDASGCDIEQHYSMDMLYQAFKKPLKAHLTEVPYTFSFGEQSGENDTRILEVSREYDSESKLNFIVAPRAN